MVVKVAISTYSTYKLSNWLNSSNNTEFSQFAVSLWTNLCMEIGPMMVELLFQATILGRLVFTHMRMKLISINLLGYNNFSNLKIKDHLITHLRESLLSQCFVLIIWHLMRYNLKDFWLDSQILTHNLQP